MYACVRYIDDLGKKCIVKCDAIKNFEQHNLDTSLLYEVWWEPSGTSKNSSPCGYYLAQILLVKETKEELQTFITEKRIRLPKLPRDAMQAKLPADARKEATSEREKSKEKRARVEAASKKALTQILSKSLEATRMSSLTNTQTDMDNEDYDPVLNLENFPEVQKKNVLEMEEKIERLQKCSMRLRAELTSVQRESYNLVKENASLLSENATMRTEVDNVRKLNYDLQSTLMAKILQYDTSSITYVGNETGQFVPELPDVPEDPLEGFQLAPAENVSKVDHLSSEMDADVPLLDEQKQENEVFKPIYLDGKVYLGGASINGEQWDLIQKSKSPSVFCKELALAIWTADGLRMKSVTGLPCRAKKDVEQKPGLTPTKRDAIANALDFHMNNKGAQKPQIEDTKKKINHFLNEKIQDLTKKSNKRTVNPAK